jgi:hypothetical protein
MNLLKYCKQGKLCRFWSLMQTQLLILGTSATAMEFEYRPANTGNQSITTTATGAISAAPSPLQKGQLVMSGRVEGNELRILKDWLDKQPDIETIILKNSNGGDAATGYAVGEFIRSKGLTTAVSGHCLSSCSRMYLGGKRRYFTDEQAAERTVVGFHGNYKGDGTLINTYHLKSWIIKYFDWTDEQRKLYEPLVEQWVNTPNRQGFMYFFDENRYKAAGESSVMYCNGSEPRQERVALCEKKKGFSSRELGVIKE